MSTEGTPLTKYYDSFAKAKEEETRRIVAKTDEISEGYDFIPKLDKKKAAKSKKEPEEFKGIFGDDDDDQSSDNEMVRITLISVVVVWLPSTTVLEGILYA